jgi:putative tryptophan/tyrosine transport system substrate-binding protein
MRRREFTASLLAAGAFPWAAAAQDAGRVYRLGFLTPAVPSSDGTSVEELLPRALAELGYAEGRTLKIERRYANNDMTRLSALARDLARARVDLIVAVGPSAVQAAKDGAPSVPVVMGFGPSPVEFGFVQSLARPGGRITGVAYTVTELATKRLEYLRLVVPSARRIAILATTESSATAQVQQARKTAAVLGVEIAVVTVSDDDYERAFAAIAAEKASGVFVLASSILNRARRRIIPLALRAGLPAIYEWREHVDEGGLMAYGTSIWALSRRVAIFVHKILQGADPAGLPVEQPTVFELAINLKTAKALRLTMPESLLALADVVIE